MTCYIVQTAEPKPRYGNRNRLMNHRHNAVVYPSPSAAKLAARRMLLLHDNLPGVWVLVYNQDRHPEAKPLLVQRQDLGA